MARRGQPQPGGRRGGPGRQQQRRGRRREDVVSVLTRAVDEIGSALKKGRATTATRTKFQAVALLLRDERARVRANDDLSEARRGERLKKLDEIATSLARTAVRDQALLALLGEDAVVSDEARSLEHDMMRRAGITPSRAEEPPVEQEDEPAPAPARTGVVPQSVVSRQMANPFLAPDFSARPAAHRPTRLDGWELLDPLLRSFERAGDGSACMTLPAPGSRKPTAGMELMPHQAGVVAAAAEGHRTFLLADEPGLGKTAQALLAAEAAKAYPLLVVAPNVVKTNWVREAGLWSTRRKATAIQGDGDTVDGFADIVVVNYEVLDRHVGWLRDFGFRGMVVDEAHFIKNKTSQRSQHVLALAERIRSFTPNPLLMALTGTPLINDIEDFLAIWEFLGWIDVKKPVGPLMDALTETGLTPADRGFYPAARQAVVDRGIVRRRKVDVAADIPARRIADLPVELDGPTGRSIRAAERDLAQRMVSRYTDALAARDTGAVEGIDHDLVARVATWEQKDATNASNGDNVFSMMRRIGQAKATLAADYAVQLARSSGKVVFFAKHVDVMDAAEETFAKQSVRFSSIRGDQTPKVRQQNIDAFVEDPDVAVAVCSLTAAGVGINLQVASDIVLAELPWTAAEQTQAIDRCHRIGQTQPVTAWRILAAQTIDARIADLLGEKANLAAVALDGADEELGTSTDAQHAALVALLTEALQASA